MSANANRIRILRNRLATTGPNNNNVRQRWADELSTLLYLDSQTDGARAAVAAEEARMGALLRANRGNM